jgi:hypothetical protein
MLFFFVLYNTNMTFGMESVKMISSEGPHR